MKVTKKDLRKLHRKLKKQASGKLGAEEYKLTNSSFKQWTRENGQFIVNHFSSANKSVEYTDEALKLLLDFV